MTVLNSHVFCIDCHAPYLGVRKHKAPRCRPCWLKWVKDTKTKRHCIDCGAPQTYDTWKHSKSETVRCRVCNMLHNRAHQIEVYAVA